MGQLDLVIQEFSPFITYTSGWFEGTDNKTEDPFFAEYNGTFRPTETKNSQASFSFTGTAAAIFGALRDNHGSYSISLDDQMPIIGSGFRQPNQFNQTLWNISNLAYQEHNVTITNLPDSHGSWLDIDYILIHRQIGNAKLVNFLENWTRILTEITSDGIFQVTLEDNSHVGINYTGSWQQLPISTASENGLHRTASAGSQVAITFRGCCLEVYGQYANANYTVVLDGQIPQTYTGLDFDLGDARQHPQSLLYLVDNLSEDDLHTVLITNLHSLDQRPFFFDYAVVSSTKSIDFGTTDNNTSSNPNPRPTATSSSRKTNIGAIAGATVAGVIIIVIIGTIALLLLRRKKRGQHVHQPETRATIGEVHPYIVANNNNNYVEARPASERVLGAHYISMPPVSTTSGSMDNVSSLSGAKTTTTGMVLQRPIGSSSHREVDSGTTFHNGDNQIEPAMLPPAYDAEWDRTRQLG